MIARNRRKAGLKRLDWQCLDRKTVDEMKIGITMLFRALIFIPLLNVPANAQGLDLSKELDLSDVNVQFVCREALTTVNARWDGRQEEALACLDSCEKQLITPDPTNEAWIYCVRLRDLNRRLNLPPWASFQ